MQYLFVITYGRSGSTVLLNLLNAIDGYTIRGENAGIVNHLAKTVSLLEEAQAEPHAKSVNPHAPWYGILDPDVESWGQRLADAFAAEFLRPDPDTRVLGFKEIRYTDDHVTDAEYHDTIEFLSRFFPGSRFIFNTRAWSEVVESGWWRYYPNVKEVSDLVRTADKRFAESIARLGDRAFLIDHSEFAGNPAGFRPLISWLGETLSDAELEKITRHKPKHMQLAHEDRGRLLRLRRLVSKRLAGAPFKGSARRVSGS